jgi:glycopeptide antibiotics resistance protein
MPYFNLYSNGKYLLAGLVIICIEIIVLILQKKFSRKQISTSQFIFRLMFTIYVSLVFLITLIPNPISTGSVHATGNFIPAIDIYYAFHFRITHLMYEHLLNILLFIPFGFLFSIVFKNGKRFSVMLMAVIFVSCSIEILQWVLPNSNRVFDINDIICNVVGGLGGYAFDIIIEVLIHKKYQEKKRLFVFIFVCIATIILPIKSVFTSNYYNVYMIDSPMFVPASIEFKATENWPQKTFLYKPDNTGTVQLTSKNLNGYQGGASPCGEIRIIDPADAANRCLSGVMLSIYTEGLPRPDTIIINNMELNYFLNSDQSLIIPVWCFYGEAVKQIVTEDGQTKVERKKAEIFAPAFF